MVETKITNEDASTRPCNAVPRLASIFKGLVGYLKQFLLRCIHGLHLKARDTKEGVAEQASILFEEARTSRGDRPRMLRIGMMEAIS